MIINIKIKNNYGQGILEIIVALAIFSLIAASMTSLVLGSFYTLEQGGEHTEAEALAGEGIEAVRAVRNRDWANLSCTNCIVTISGNQWELVNGPSEVINSKYERFITISDVYRDSNNDISMAGTLDEYTKLVEVEVMWTIRGNITNSVKRVEYMTNWTYLAGGDCLSVDTSSACFDNLENYQSLKNITLTNNCPDNIIAISSTPVWDSVAKIEDISIDGVSRWNWECNWNCTPTSRQDSGVELDFGDNDLTISGNSTIDVDTYLWNANMSGTEINLLFTFDDLTTASTTPFSPPTCGSVNVNSYCQSLGYASGICRANSNQCTSSGEVYESGGDVYCTGGGGADTACCVPAADTIAPSAISDLATSNPSISSIDLSWTSPGDDAGTGTATSYDIRYSTVTITEANWNLATEVTGEPTPLLSGISQSMTVSGLDPDTTYYFAIKTSDEVPNISSISNIATGTTLPLTATTIFYETFPNADNAWNGSSDTAQDEPNWFIIQGNGDNDDIQVTNAAVGTSPSGGNHLTFEDCDQGFLIPETYDIAYVSVDLSGYFSVSIEYYWQSDDLDPGEGFRVAYSVNSTNGIDGTWTQISEFIDPTDDIWTLDSYSLPDVDATSTFVIRFSSFSNKTNEHVYIDDIKILGY